MLQWKAQALAWAIFAAFALVGGMAYAGDEVKLDSGRVKGATAEGVTSFKGIPYAAAPVGPLRWRAPQPVTPWHGVRAATSYGADCAQSPFPGDAAPLGVTPAEDCLYANVWVPAAAPRHRMAVMVWIYGGGFVNGGSSPAVYDGSSFARRGVVLVSFNYRVGRFGFFAHPALSKEHPEEPHGNYGYLDQIAALRWVKRNAAAFGGDPDNVTVFGESAGGGSVHMLLSSPLAKGLFQKAIIESGGGRTTLTAPRSIDQSVPGLPSAESVGVAFARHNQIEGDGAEALAALRALPAEKVIAGLNMMTMSNPTYAGPMIDGRVVIESPEAAYQAGRGAKVPLIVGATNNDIGFGFVRTKDELFQKFGANAARARALYDPAGQAALRGLAQAVAADAMMVEPARYTARLFAALGKPVYEFRFSYVAESMRKEWKGAPHATEIPYVFDTVAARYGKDLTPADKATAEAANAYWVNFAKTGNPNGKGLPAWPAYTAAKDELLEFTPQGPKAVADAWKERLDLTEKLAR
jgi:para-nitrobenzyl esterase